MRPAMKSAFCLAIIVPIAVLAWPGEAVQQKTQRLRGEIVDAEGSARLPARIYIQGADGAWHFPTSAGGSAFTYKKQRGDNPKCV